MLFADTFAAGLPFEECYILLSRKLSTYLSVADEASFTTFQKELNLWHFKIGNASLKWINF